MVDPRRRDSSVVKTLLSDTLAEQRELASPSPGVILIGRPLDALYGAQPVEAQPWLPKTELGQLALHST